MEAEITKIPNLAAAGVVATQADGTLENKVFSADPTKFLDGTGSFTTPPDTNTNFANTDLTATGDRNHDFDEFNLIITELDELQFRRAVAIISQQVIRMFTSGTQQNIFLRSTDGVDNATIQLICDTSHVTSQLELSAFGGTVIDIDCDTRVRFGTTATTGSAKIRIMGNTNTHYVELKVSDSIPSDFSFQLPHTVVTNGFCKTDVSGVLTFVLVTGEELSLSDLTTNNATTARHGFLRKLSNVATEYMDGTGNWSVPAGAGGGLTRGKAVAMVAGYMGL